jgi:hypothetical protein
LTTDLWPRTARLETDGDISIGGLRLSTLVLIQGLLPAWTISSPRGRQRPPGAPEPMIVAP